MKKIFIAITIVASLVGVAIIATAALLFRKKEMNELLEME